MGFLLSSFFAALVSSTTGLPLRWVFFTFAFTTGASLRWVPACARPPPRGGCFSQVKPESRHHRCQESVCSSVFVSSQQRFALKPHAGVGGESPLAPLYIYIYIYIFFFFPSLGLSYVNWASQECCLFYLRFSLQSLDLPLFYLLRLFPSRSFRNRHSGLLFPILTT